MVKFSLYESPSGARPPGLSRSAKLSCCASSSQILVLEEAEAEISSLKDLKFLCAYIVDLGDHRALEQLRRVLRLLTSLKDPTPLSLLPFGRLRSLELRDVIFRPPLCEDCWSSGILWRKSSATIPRTLSGIFLLEGLLKYRIALHGLGYLLFSWMI